MRPTIKTVKIDLDRERALRFDFNALSLFEETTGLNSLDASIWSSLNAKSLRAMLWAALKHDDPSLTQEQVGAMLHSGNIGYITERITEAYKASTPDQPEGEETKN
jgi:hypothetical protein